MPSAPPPQSALASARPRAPAVRAPRAAAYGRGRLDDVAFRPAGVLLAGYLAATLVPLALAGAHGDAHPRARGAALLAAHLALLAGAAWAARSGRVRDSTRATAAWARAWLPLAAVPLLYAELPLVAAGLGRAALHDATVVGWEAALFGASPAVTLARRVPWPPLSELLHAGYLSYYALIYLPPALLWRRAARGDAGAARAFAAATFTVLLAFLGCYAVFALFPVEGPWHAWPAPAAVPDGPVRGLVQALLDAGSSRGTAFPSSHVAVAVAQTAALARLAPALAAPAAAATLLLATGAVYGGFHYGVDVVAGALAGLLVGAAGPALWRRWGGARWRA